MHSSLDFYRIKVNFEKNLFSILFPLLSCLIFKNHLHGGICGKVDVGPAFVHMDILQSGKTIRRMDMLAFRGDACLCIYKGLTLKPTFLYGANDGMLLTAGIALGPAIPITPKVTLLPSIGFSYSRVTAFIKNKTPFAFLGPHRFKEHFQSNSPFVGIEAYYTFAPTWRLCGSFQYAWSRTKTRIKNLLSDHSKAKGPNYALMVEKDMSCKWSINLGMGYNLSLSKEKHGVRGMGVKLGLARWY